MRLERAREEYSARLHTHIIRKADTHNVMWTGVVPGRRSVITTSHDTQKMACIYAQAKNAYAHIYGLDRFNASSRGYKSAPARQRWITNRLTKNLQCQSHQHQRIQHLAGLLSCFTNRKLCAVGSNRDPFPSQPGSIQKHHFVRRCTICRTIWNRDVNASRNMAYLALHKIYGMDRPVVFSSRLDQAPIVRDEHTDNTTNITSQA
ncbi:hypothetical protein NQZ79_g4109 [Umbelopsis isabellina]|nr:hypothetical protein NQZ79_g4109 [Umbelopsis isabellina]